MIASGSVEPTHVEVPDRPTVTWCLTTKTDVQSLVKTESDSAEVIERWSPQETSAAPLITQQDAELTSDEVSRERSKSESESVSKYPCLLMCPAFSVASLELIVSGSGCVN